MKKMIFFICLLLSGITTNSVKSQNLFDNWSTLKTYHDVLSMTFHPSETGDLAPIKARSGELANHAKAVAASAIPAAFNNRAMRRTVRKLKSDSVRLDQLIKSNKLTDAQIIAKLAAVHDVFHKIVELSKAEHEHE